MITNLNITNFKGFCGTVNIPIRAITLLFGTNSSGKSSVLQALQYLKEVLERQNFDADKTFDGAGSVDLGGFRNFVFGHDLTRSVKFKIDLDLSDVELPRFESEQENDDLSGRVTSGYVDITISWSDFLQSPICTSFAVGVNDYVLGIFQASMDGKRIELVDVNFRHPIFISDENREGLSEIELIINDLAEQASFKGPINIFSIADQTSAIPSFSRGLNLKQPWMDFCDDLSGLKMLNLILSQLLVGIGKTLLIELRHLRYVGPMRTPPPRDHIPLLSRDASRWSTGLAAWDALYDKPSVFLDEVKDWLANDGKLNTGYSLHLRQFKELDIFSPFFISLTSNTYFDDIDSLKISLQQLPIKKRLVFTELRTGFTFGAPDIGIGLSQVVPVVVAALADDAKIITIEQPELHIHPAVQVGLGDLFADQIRKRRCTFILETHSEHLLLRLLRRLREENEFFFQNDKPKISPDDLSVLYLEQLSSGIRVSSLRLDPSGEFIDRWPNGLFEERIAEL